MRTLHMLVLLFAASLVSAQERDLLNVESYTAMINMMADCSGTWEFFGALEAKTGKHASARQMLELRNGASLSAKYLLQVEHADRTGQPKAIGEFEPYVLARQETTITRLMSLLERQSYEQLEAEMGRCTDALEFQEGVIQLLRDATYRN